MTVAEIVSTGRVTVCCGAHSTRGCCDPADCAPCCPECPTCAVVQSRTPAQRAVEAVAYRVLLADLVEWARDIRTAPTGREAPPWSTSSP
ncbi:hypothetical protein NLX83_10900 [Allokutzneria sp. A3M-2-11 16]|uniref:hypothetical protein n=1 Tax=Allokutzneria sp. A3M-2-11 16 TaxID=2962043 RepID=UPI0020B8ED37|nr:hypothetical protein [Allokutzneria sp. A3M-2-11 16]MCP3799766.1 hypothetical protein [Allokutzneria sp. A3M-2-11 16]